MEIMAEDMKEFSHTEAEIVKITGAHNGIIIKTTDVAIIQHLYAYKNDLMTVVMTVDKSGETTEDMITAITVVKAETGKMVNMIDESKKSIHLFGEDNSIT